MANDKDTGMRLQLAHDTVDITKREPVFPKSKVIAELGRRGRELLEAATAATQEFEPHHRRQQPYSDRQVGSFLTQLATSLEQTDNTMPDRITGDDIIKAAARVTNALKKLEKGNPEQSKNADIEERPIDPDHKIPAEAYRAIMCEIQQALAKAQMPQTKQETSSNRLSLLPRPEVVPEPAAIYQLPDDALSAALFPAEPANLTRMQRYKRGLGELGHSAQRFLSPGPSDNETSSKGR